MKNFESKEHFLTGFLSKALAFAEKAKYDDAAQKEYEIHYRDWKNAVDTAMGETKAEIASAMKTEGLAPELIAKLTGLAIDEIAKL